MNRLTYAVFLAFLVVLVTILLQFAALAVGWQGGTNGILVAGGIYAIFALSVLVILAFIPGERRENRWGVPPEFGVHLKRDTSEPKPGIEWQNR
jgi:hypothetical protein